MPHSRSYPRISYALLVICLTKALIWSSVLGYAAAAADTQAIGNFIAREKVYALHADHESSKDQHPQRSEMLHPIAPEINSVKVAAADRHHGISPSDSQPNHFLPHAGAHHSSTIDSDDSDGEIPDPDDWRVAALELLEEAPRTPEDQAAQEALINLLKMAPRVRTPRASPPSAKSSVTSYTPIRQAGYCSTYGVCDPTSDPTANPVNCVNNIPAVPLNFSAPLCSIYFDHVCCSEAQYNTMASNLAQADPFFSRCPACQDNFRKWWCEYTCSPDQSVFVDVKQIENKTIQESGQSVNVTVVSNTLATLGYDFAWGVFTSCLNVKFGTTGQTVLSILFHNPQTPYDFFSFMGNTPTSPFQIDFIVEPPGYFNLSLQNVSTESCAQSCSCSDCPSPTCPAA